MAVGWKSGMYNTNSNQLDMKQQSPSKDRIGHISSNDKNNHLTTQRISSNYHRNGNNDIVVTSSSSHGTTTITKCNVDIPRPIKRYPPTQILNELAGCKPNTNTPKKLFPPTTIFQPLEKRRRYRLNVTPSYTVYPHTTPNSPPIGDINHTESIEKIGPAPPLTTATQKELRVPCSLSTSTAISSPPHLITTIKKELPIPLSLYTPTAISSSPRLTTTIKKEPLTPLSLPTPTAISSSSTPTAVSSSSKPTTMPSSTSSSQISVSTLSNTSSNGKNGQDHPTLSDEQRHILDMAVKDKQSMFLTGSAGTGKSVLMMEIIRNLRNLYGEAVAVTASTGIAACNIGGITLHGFAGIGFGDQSSSQLIRRIKMNPMAMKRWQKTKVLIIDEISMVDAALFDKLADIGQHIRGRNEAFGGIQVIATGDFFQLPPVRGSGFAFEAETWSDVMKKTMVLTRVFRQKDTEFVDILNEMRIGVLSHKAIKLFKSLERPLLDSSIEPTKLYPLKHQVKQSNNMRLEALVGSLHEFEAFDYGEDVKRLECCRAPALLRLKVNAQVMLLKNIDSTLVNGSLGIVVGFAGEGNFDNPGAIKSRLFPRRREQVNDADLKYIMSKCYPVVRFVNGREHIIENELWSMCLADGTVVANREQIPLVLAWAMSIHKSQGQTLDRVVVDLNEAFEDGMAYVALSRATSQQALQITNFNPVKVTTSRKVVAFYKSLQHVV